jgi:acyl carrier protein phosphodiesterase
MNHLAHALLAGGDEGLRLGGVMGDFVRGTPDPHLPPSVIAGIRLHRAIDSFTDRHPEVAAARERLPAPYRRYGGILLDMWFDHLLARDFRRWSGQSLVECSDTLRELLHRHDALLPEPLRRFRTYMDAHDLPAGYADPAMLDVALRGIGSRLSRANPLATALPQLQALEAPLQGHFEAFFPEVLAFADGWSVDMPPASGLRP